MSTSSYNVILIVIATISTIFTFILLKLMSKQPFNGFAILIFSLAISTIIYDISFYFHLQPANWGNGMAMLIEMFGDLSMGIWTNIISITLIRIVYTLKNVHIVKEYPVYIISNIALVIGVVAYAAKTSGFDIEIDTHSFRIYYIIRTIQVIVNVFLYILTYIKVMLIQYDVQKGLITSVQAQTVTTLVGRMGYYALIQIVMRIFPTIYGADEDSQDNAGIHYLAVLTAPSCGIWYFFLYLYIQPTLWQEVKKIVLKLPLIGNWLRNQQASKRQISVAHDTWRITMEDIELSELTANNPLNFDINQVAEASHVSTGDATQSHPGLPSIQESSQSEERESSAADTDAA